MVSLGFQKKIVSTILKIIDKKFGELKISGIPVDKMTDLLQGQDNKLRDLELRLDALEHFLKEEDK